jgi:hypothetical protein
MRAKEILKERDEGQEGLLNTIHIPALKNWWVSSQAFSFRCADPEKESFNGRLAVEVWLAEEESES